MPTSWRLVSAASPGRSESRWRVHVAWMVVLLVAVAGTWWAASTVVRPAGAQEEVRTETPVYTVARGEVGVSMSVTGEMSFADGPPGLAGAGGTLTSLDVDPGEPIEAGDVLFTIDLRPVVAAQGAIPAFRDLQAGDGGPDVAQLREFLGLEEGEDFDAATTAAVRAWQDELGIAADGVVRLGDVLFLPSLPTRGYAQDDLVVGSPVTVGQQVITTVQEVPGVVALPDSTSTVQPGMAARVSIGDEVLEGVLGPARTRADGLRAHEVLDADGEPVCGAPCAEVASVTTATQVSVEIDVVPTQEGLVVPDAALVLQPDGTTAVRTAEGEVIAVDVAIQGQGVSIVEGVAEGTVIELFGQDSS